MAKIPRLAIHAAQSVEVPTIRWINGSPPFKPENAHRDNRSINIGTTTKPTYPDGYSTKKKLYTNQTTLLRHQGEGDTASTTKKLQDAPNTRHPQRVLTSRELIEVPRIPVVDTLTPGILDLSGEKQK